MGEGGEEERTEKPEPLTVVIESARTSLYLQRASARVEGEEMGEDADPNASRKA